MSPVSESKSAKREACYLVISEERFAIGILKQISSHYLPKVFREFEEKKLFFTDEQKKAARKIGGENLIQHLQKEYVKRILNIYKTYLKTLTDNELTTVALDPTGSSIHSQAHEKFFQLEKNALLQNKEKIIEELFEEGNRLTKDQQFLKKILELSNQSSHQNLLKQ